MSIPQPPLRWLTWPNWLRFCGGTLITLSVVSLIGRALGSWDLASLVPGGNPMAGNSALSQIALGLAFWLLAAGRRRPAQLCGWGVSLFVALIGLQYPTGWSFGIDELFIRHTLPPPMPHPGRLAPNTILSLILAGMAVAMLAQPRSRTGWMSLLTGLLLGSALLALLSYATQLQLTLLGGLSFGMSVGSALGMVLVAITCMVGWERGTRVPRLMRPLTITAIMLLASVGLFSLYLHEDHEEAKRRLVRSYEVVASLNYLELCLTRMQSAARVHAVTGEAGDRAYLTDTGGRLRAELNHLDGLVADRPEILADCRKLRELVAAEQAYLDRLVGLRSTDGTTAAQDVLRTNPDRPMLEAVREQVNQLEETERRQQEHYDREVARTSFETTKVIILGNILAGVFTLLAIYLSRRADDARQAAEQGLRELSGLQQAVLDGTVHSVVSTTPEGVITLFSRGAEKMLGYTAAEMIGRQTSVIFHVGEEMAARAADLREQLGREVGPGFEAVVARARLGEADEREWTYLRKDGTRLPVQLSVTALRDDAGLITGFLGIAQDLTERKRAEDALASSEAQFRNAFDYAGIGMALVGLDGRWLQVNQNLRHMLGYAEPELLARTFQDVTHPDDLQTDLANVQDLLAGRRRHYQMEKRYIHREGRIVHVRLAVTLVRDTAGAPRHFVSQIEDITARHQAEQALIGSQRQLNDVFRSMAEGLVLQDAQGRIIECNAAAENILGVPRTQLIGLTASDPRWQAFNEDGTPSPADRHPATITRMTGQSCRGVVIGVQRTDGTRRWLSVNTEAILDEHAYLKAVVASFTDITARKQAEEALRRSQQLFQRLFESSPDAIVLVDRRGRIVRTNVRAETLFGWPAGDLTGQALEVLLPPRLRERHGLHLTKYFQNPHARAMGAGLELAGLRKDGSEFPVDIMLSPLETPEGTQTLAVVRDITSRRQMEQALRESEERTRLFAEHAPAAVAMFDRGMCYLVHSDKWLKDYGLEGRDIIGRSHYEVFPEIGERWKEIHRRCLAGAIEINEADLFVRADGSEQWLSWRVQPWHTGTEEIGGIIMFTEDITRQKQLEVSLALARDQALEASRLKSAFLANMSHEIRTPMNGVIGMMELMMDSSLTEEQQQMGRVIQNSARNLLTVIDDILDFSKIEAGKLSVEEKDFDLVEQIDQALALLSPRAQERGLALQNEPPPATVPRLRGDPARLQQVLVNLLGNAVKFTEKGVVSLTLLPRPSAAPERYAFRVEVRDTGIGIAPAKQARLFEPFVQADDSATRRYGGTGLGLAISRQLVELMGGRIGFESESGSGSTFWFELELPRSSAPAPARPGRTTVGTATPAGPAPRVLVAEDNEANQLVIRLMLQKLGLEFDLVADGHEAIARLAGGGYAAVLMDCQMPGLDGYEATRRIRGGAAGTAEARIPILALTAHAMASDRVKCLAAGMDDYLAKPIRLEALQHALLRFGIHTVIAVTSDKPAVQAAGAVLDAGQLAELRALPGEKPGETLLDLLIRRSLVEIPPGLARLHTLIERQQAAELAQAAHRVAGSMASIGGVALRRVLLGLEEAARHGDWSTVSARRSELDRQWRLLQDALRALQEPKGP